MRSAFIATLALGLMITITYASEPERVVGANWAQARKFTKEFVEQHVQVASIAPQFIGKTDLFWYAVRTPQGIRYWKVDPANKSKVPLFDHPKLIAQLSELSRKPLDVASFTIRNAKVSDDGGKFSFQFETSAYEFDLTANTLKKTGRAQPEVAGIPPEMLERMTEDERREFLDRLREQNEQQKKDDKKDDTIKQELKKDDTIKQELKKDDSIKQELKKVELKKDDNQQENKKELKTEVKQGITSKSGPPGLGDYKAYSPDKKKYLYAYKFNLYLAEEGKESEAKQLTTDGEEDYGYGIGPTSRRTDGTVEKPQPPSDRKSRPQVTWSKDSKRFVVTRTDRRGMKELFLVDSIATPRPALERYRYAMPGEPGISKSELYWGDADAKTLTRVKPKWKDEAYVDIRFGKTSNLLEFIRRDRLRRHHDYCRLNLTTGEEKCLISEGFDAAYLELQTPRILEETDEVIWWSERSGWAHFYLYDREGVLKNPITSGEWRASRIVDVDIKNRLMYFIGNAREPGENVYYTHLYRVRLDGSDLTNLTPGNANHRATLSPSKQYAVSVSSRTDLAPAARLFNDKGQVIMELESTDLTLLKSTGWKMPEVFTVKAADGVTDLYGNMWKPFDFNPNKKYPIIAYVYPGPQTEGVTHTFSAWSSYQQLAQLGFVVIQVGHRGGSPERSKAYHSFGYFNLRDYALSDKKAAIEALAARHPWIDLDRVGIYGHSGGGFLSAAAMLQTPYNDFFKAAVASAGNHDNNIYNNYWSETYHGLKEVPVTEEKKEGNSQGQNSSKGGFMRQRKGGPDDADQMVEVSPPPRRVTSDCDTDKPWQDTVAELQKKLDQIKQKLSDAISKGNAKKEDLDLLMKQLLEIRQQLDANKRQGLAQKDHSNKLESEKDKGQKEKDRDQKDDSKKELDKKDPPKTRFDIRVPTNAELAGNLKGHLLLVHGEIDNNVHPANTMRLVDALIKANKRFDLLIIPGARHGFGAAQPYFTDRMWDFFAEHLLEDRQTRANIKDRVPFKK